MNAGRMGDDNLAFDVISGAGSIFNQPIDDLQDKLMNKESNKKRNRGASTTMPTAKKMDYQVKETKNQRGNKLSDMYVPEEIPLTLFRADRKRDNPFKLAEEDNITEEQLDDLRNLKDREKVATLEKEQRKQAELKLKKQA